MSKCCDGKCNEIAIIAVGGRNGKMFDYCHEHFQEFVECCGNVQFEQWFCPDKQTKLAW